MKAKTTASGSAPPASGEPNGIDAAIAAPGAMEQIDWNTTSRKPIAPLSSFVSLLITLLISEVSALVGLIGRHAREESVTFIGHLWSLMSQEICNNLVNQKNLHA